MIIEVRSLYCEKCSVIRPIYFTSRILSNRPLL
jgi:hypothetical protein